MSAPRDAVSPQPAAHEPPRQKWQARIALLVLAALGLLWLARVDFSQKISTNVIDLIPDDQQSPELALVRSLASERQARVVLFSLSTPGRPGPAPAAAAEAFAETLRRSPLFAEVVLILDTRARDALGRFIYERRFDYLLPSWLGEQERRFAASGRPAEERAAWIAGETARELDTFLNRPEASAFQDLVLSDPLLLVPSLVQQSQGIAAPGANAQGEALIWAQLSVSPLGEEGQEPVFAAIDQALASVRTAHPGVELAWTGVSRFAAESKNRIRGELEWLNTLSLLAVLGIALAFVRRVWKALHLVPVVLLSLLGGWVGVTLAFERIHLLVFVVGALLTGVAIDYAFYLYLQPPLRDGEPYREKLARLIKPLLTSCLTTVLGFSFLLFSELPLIRQLGVFVSAGLISALTAAILYFAQIDRAFMESRTFVVPRPRTARGRGMVKLLGVLALAVAAIGPWFLRWHDDIRQLEVPARELQANDQRLRALFGDNPDQTVYLTRGAGVEEARTRLNQFQTWHAGTFKSAAASLGLVLPTAEDYRELPARLATLRGFEEAFRAALEKAGYLPESFATFFSAWQEQLGRSTFPPYAELASSLRGNLQGPLGMLLETSPGQTWFLSIADHPPGAEPPPELGTVSVNQLQSLNTLFARYRGSALRLSVAGLSLVGLSVFVLYGLRRGVRIFMIPAGACFFAFGLLGLCGQTLNLFHLLGAFLGVCLSHNYAIFSAENSGRGEAPPISIRLSALSTAASFGVLALSKIVVVAALGSIVALIVMTALLMVELEPLSRDSSPPA